MNSVAPLSGSHVSKASKEGLIRILLAEPDDEAASLATAALCLDMKSRVSTVRVSTLADAIRALMESSFDATVLEWAMPDARGIAVLASVRGAAPKVPVIVYSADLDDTQTLRALRAGAQECINKSSSESNGLARAVGFAMERQRRLATLEAARSDAAHRATHDPLTGLANRELFLDQLERALAFGARYGRKTALLFVDLDGFKAINDHLGHATGDLLLQVVSSRLLKCVRRSDGIGRLGGDEFVVLLPDVTSRRDVAFVRDSILDCLREPVQIGDGQSLICHASIGSAMSPLDGATAKELLNAADHDMYHEKDLRRRGRAPTPAAGISWISKDDEVRQHPTEFEGTISLASVAQRREARLRRAIRNSEFEVYFQPILDVVADRVIATEALLRWRDPDRGLVLPSTFVPLAEDTGLIVPIGDEMLRSACESLVRWRRNGASSGLRMCVNLSSVQLREHGFERRVGAILEETGCPASALTLELTESSTMIDGELAIETLRALKALGVRLVIDDFGVGHASLTFLREAPVDGIKIDRRFISNMLSDPRDLVIVGALAKLARGLGLDVIAEGVESAEQSQRLARLQCFVQQGNHFSDAVSGAAMAVLLETAPMSEPDIRTWRARGGNEYAS